jgi:hypothetical protein
MGEQVPYLFDGKHTFLKAGQTVVTVVTVGIFG